MKQFGNSTFQNFQKKTSFLLIQVVCGPLQENVFLPQFLAKKTITF